MAETASPAKVAALQALPVTLVRHGAGYDEAEAHALELAARGATYVSSYNDTGVIAGQSTIGRELEAQLAAPSTVACPLGGGSLASGLGLWAAGGTARASSRSRPSARPRSRPRSRRARSRRRGGETLADGLAGNLEPGSATFELVRDHVAAVVRSPSPRSRRRSASSRGARDRRRGRGRRAVAGVRPAAAARRRPARPRRDGPQHRADAAGGGAAGVAARMPCLIALFALIGPRIALVFTWLFSGMIGRAIDSAFVAILGFLLLPWTTLAYVVFYDVGAGREVKGSSGSSSASRSSPTWVVRRRSPGARRSSGRERAGASCSGGRRRQRELRRGDAQVVAERPVRRAAVRERPRHRGERARAQPRDRVLDLQHRRVLPAVRRREAVVARERLLARARALQHGAQLAPARDAEVERRADPLGGERQAVAGRVAGEEDPVLGGRAELVRDPVALVAVGRQPERRRPGAASGA